MTSALQPNPRAAASLRIRRARPDDAEAIARVLDQAFAVYRRLYTKEAFNATVLSKDEVRSRIEEGPVWVALPVIDDRLVATVSAVATAQGCYIRGMAVLPAARGQGIGWQLLERIEHFALEASFSRLYLSTTPFLDRAISLYARYGFRRSDQGPLSLFGTPLFTMVKGLSSEGGRA